MWLAVEADDQGVRAWPIGIDGGGMLGSGPGGGTVTPPVVATSLPVLLATFPAPPDGIVLDGATEADDIALPAALADLARRDSRAQRDSADGLQTLQVARPAGLARLVGGHRLAHSATPAGAQRPWHACLCRADGQTLWAHGAEGQIRRLSVQPVQRRLHALLGDLAALGAQDGDDDLGFERGLSLTEAEGALDDDLAAVVAEARIGRLKGEAVGANLAGVLIGHDAMKGLRLGRPGQPVAVIGAGLVAQRYAIALGRFGVAVRRVDPDRAFIAGAAFFAQRE